MFLSFRTIFLFTLLISANVLPAFAQEVNVSKEKTDKKEENKKEEKSGNKQQNVDLSKLSAEPYLLASMLLKTSSRTLIMVGRSIFLSSLNSEKVSIKLIFSIF